MDQWLRNAGNVNRVDMPLELAALAAIHPQLGTSDIPMLSSSNVSLMWELGLRLENQHLQGLQQ
jgi:hypothetical protein